MAAATLDAVRRDKFGKNENVRLRQSGRLPAVLYGGAGRTGEPVSVDPKALLHILHSEAGVNTLIALKLEGAGDSRVLVKEYQLDPVSRKLLHADFYRVAMDKVIRVTVQVRLIGEAKGVKAEGGVVDFVHREIAVESLPADIPEHIDIDISELMLNQGVRVRDLAPSDKWKPVNEPEMLIVHVVAPKQAEPEPTADAAAAPTAAAEPEVIKKGKGDKVEGEEPKAKDAKDAKPKEKGKG